MYLDYFTLKEKPFSITPDPAYLFLSERHAEALAHLVYGVTDSGGFIQLTGEVGTGKTTIVRSLLEQLPENVDVALVLNPRLSVNEFLHTICDELHIQVEKGASNKDCIDVLNHFLLDAYGNDRRVVLLIDEAQNLSVEVLEQIRLLTNLETHKHKLLQIVLVGQPELQTLLQRQDLRQLAQRITARYHLRPLNQQESHDYLSHRLSVAGGQPDLISSKAKTTIYKASQGIPRLMNVIADRSLLGAYSQEKKQVDQAIAKHSIREVVGDEVVLMGKKESKPLSKWWLAPVVAAMGLVGASWFYGQGPGLIKKVPPSVADIEKQSEIMSTDVKPMTEESYEGESTGVEIAHVLDNEESGERRGEMSEEDLGNVLEESENNSKPVVLSKLLSENLNLTTSEQAFNQLLSIWGKDEFSSHQNACDNLAALSLRCYFTENQTWDELLKLNRPLILEVRDEQQQMHQVTVVAVSESSATIRLAEQDQEVLLDDLVSAWTGKSLLFWQLNAAVDFPLIQIGNNGEQVVWLKEQLNQLNIEPLASLNSFSFGPITQKQVMNFQESMGLDVDGVVGIHTFMAINTKLDKLEIPTLIDIVESK